MFKVNSSISSGKRVERPEDDAIAASNIAGIESQLADTAQFQENIQQSLSELNTVDSVFGEVTSILIRVRELAVQAANASLSGDERDAIAVEVNQLLESMVQVVHGGFGGAAPELFIVDSGFGTASCHSCQSFARQSELWGTAVEMVRFHCAGCATKP